MCCRSFSCNPAGQTDTKHHIACHYRNSPHRTQALSTHQAHTRVASSLHGAALLVHHSRVCAVSRSASQLAVDVNCAGVQPRLARCSEISSTKARSPTPLADEEIECSKPGCCRLKQRVISHEHLSTTLVPRSGRLWRFMTPSAKTLRESPDLSHNLRQTGRAARACAYQYVLCFANNAWPVVGHCRFPRPVERCQYGPSSRG